MMIHRSVGIRTDEWNVVNYGFVCRETAEEKHQTRVQRIQNVKKLTHELPELLGKIVVSKEK